MNEIQSLRTKGKNNIGYVVLLSDCEQDLAEQVERYIVADWFPCGGVTMAMVRYYDEINSCYFYHRNFAQAMTARPLKVSDDNI